MGDDVNIVLLTEGDAGNVNPYSQYRGADGEFNEWLLEIQSAGVDVTVAGTNLRISNDFRYALSTNL